MRYILVTLVVALAATIKVQAADEIDWKQVLEQLETYKKTVDSLTRQVMLQQQYLEEKTRSDVDSGVKQIRVNRIGTRTFHSDTHTLRSMIAMHDHANYLDTVGLGEFAAVLNGVEFRTRHNDYKLRKPAPVGSEWGALEEIEFPDVPKAVTDKPTFKGQVEEMTNWFKAFQRDWVKSRDYKKHFKPVLCYLEGMWTNSSGEVDEPFESDRHKIDAATWWDLTKKVAFTAYSGRKSKLENFSYLPKKIMELVDGTIPKFAQWNYRIACQPLDKGEYLKPKQLMLVDDIGARMALRMNMSQILSKRTARFRIKNHPWGDARDMFYVDGALDQVMAQVPGRDGHGAVLHDEVYDLPAYHVKATFNSTEKLNTAYYHRFYKLLSKDAMGLSRMNRGFSDHSLFMAMTTNEKVVPMTTTECTGPRKNRVCKDYTQRWTYAIPLEVIYLTPLTKWNPFNIEYKGSFRDAKGKEVTKGGRNGGLDAQTAWNGTNSKTFYRTPDAFFEGGESGRDPADTVKGAAGVLNKKGEVCKVRATGIRAFLPEIKNVGIIRQRYPIAPVSMEGSAIYKELEAVKMILLKQNTYRDMLVEGGESGGREEMTELTMSITRKPSEHTHSFILSPEEVARAEKGETITAMTDEASGHTHELEVKYEAGEWKYVTCDKRSTCWDGHQNLITKN